MTATAPSPASPAAQPTAPPAAPSVVLREVGPRDGLQNEARLLPLEEKQELIRRLLAAGLRHIEIGSFVSPKAVPQMADTDQLCRTVPRPPGVVYTGLVLNARGYDRAAAAGVDAVNLALAVTETFNRRNQGAAPGESMAVFRDLVQRARADGKACSITLGTAFGCPFEGEVPEGTVLRFVEQAAGYGVELITLADTIGVAVPTQVVRLVRAARRVAGPDVAIGCHFHNTRNTGLANAYAALEEGAALLDASVGGTGGCPFAPRATGNIATEDLVYMLERMGVATGVDLEALIAAARWLEERLGHPLDGQVMKSGPFPSRTAAPAAGGEG